MLNPAHIGSPGEAIVAVTILLACLLVGALPIIKIIGWWVEGAIEPVVAITGILLFAVLVFGATLMPVQYAVVAIGGIGIFTFAWPALNALSEKKQLKGIDDERMNQFIDTLENMPNNHAVRIGLAELLYKKGDIDLALQHVEWVYEQAPSLSGRCRPLIDRWKRERDSSGLPSHMICHRCHAESPYNATSCHECGAAFGTRTGVAQNINYQGGPKVVATGWIATVSVLLVSLFILLELPAIVAAPVIFAMVIVGTWLFLRWVTGGIVSDGD